MTNYHLCIVNVILRIMMNYLGNSSYPSGKYNSFNNKSRHHNAIMRYFLTIFWSSKTIYLKVYINALIRNVFFYYIIYCCFLIDFMLVGLELWCLTPLLTIYRGSQFHWLRKSENTEKTTDLSQITDQLYHIILYRLDLAINGIRAHNVSGDSQWLHR